MSPKWLYTNIIIILTSVVITLGARSDGLKFKDICKNSKGTFSIAQSELVIAETTKNIERLAQGKIEIINLIIPKPEIPKDIAANYQKVKVEWTEKLVAEKEQEKIQVRKETEELKAIADANRLKAVKKIDIEKQILLIRQHFFDLMLVK